MIVRSTKAIHRRPLVFSNSRIPGKKHRSHACIVSGWPEIDRSMELPKRKRRPSVRLGEIGDHGFTASPPQQQQRRKQQSTSNGPPEEESVVAAASSPRLRTKKVDDDDATLNPGAPENRAAMYRDLDGANPSSHGHDEMQGAIEDLGFRPVKAGVSGWFQELGLGKYSELFQRNEVDTEVLPLLTLDDLREMGVDAVGARRKMFSNIQDLGQRR